MILLNNVQLNVVQLAVKPRRLSTGAAIKLSPVRAPLDQQTVVDAALALLGETGLNGLTLRRLSRDLGVQPGALYWHVASKQDLLNLMADKVESMAAAGLEVPLPGQSWDEWLIARVRRQREAMLAIRDGGLLMATTRLTTDRRSSAEAMIRTLATAGLPPQAAMQALRAIYSYVNGAVQAEQAGLGENLEASRYDDYPMLKASVAPRHGLTPEQAADYRRALFEYGLQCLLTGIRASVALALQPVRLDVGGAGDRSPGPAHRDPAGFRQHIADEAVGAG
jgi:TetR/AcrR family tetracycline transcriptional repressor